MSILNANARIANTVGNQSSPMSFPFASLFSSLPADSRRLLHGRGGCYPGLKHVTIDWFAPVVLLTFYKEKEENEKIRNELIRVAQESPGIEAFILQERFRSPASKMILWGKLPEAVTASENGLHYHLNLTHNQNHGFFLDMKPGRDWIRSAAEGKRVLNLFAYTCSLSVAAIAGGAESVINLDMASGALATGRRNHQLNFDNNLCQRASYLPHDLFKSWGRLVRGAPYDLIVIDPPSNQGKSFFAEKDYPRILRRLSELTHRDTQILACLNAPHLKEDFLLAQFSDYRFERRLPVATGFEEHASEANLKALLFSPQ